MSDAISDGYLLGGESTITNEKTNWMNFHDVSFYVNKSANTVYDDQTHRDESVRSMSHVAIEGSLIVTNALVGGASFENVTGLDDYHYDESGFGDSIYNNTSGDVESGTFSSPYLMPWPQRSAWITVFTMMLLVATVGNTLVAWIVLGELSTTHALKVI